MIDSLITLRNMVWFPVCFQDFLVHYWSLIVAADRITVVFNMSDVSRTIALHISRFLTGRDMVVHFIDFKFYGYSSRWLWVVQDRKSLQECLGNTGVAQFSILRSTLSYYPWMINLIMIPELLASILIVLLFSLSLIGQLILTSIRGGFWTWPCPMRGTCLG